MNPDERHTFLFADLAGFTAMTEAHGDAFAADAAADFSAAVRKLLPEYDAEEVKSIGDALLLRVPAAASAVKLGVRVIEEVGSRHGALGIRVGAHTGPAVHRDGDWFGATVNLAARVVAVAETGEVLMTAATRGDAAQALTGFEVYARGQRRFKNVGEPVEVYALTLSAQPKVAGLPVDPVCRMAVDPARSAERRVYRGIEYHFCSAECAQVFDRHPDRHAHRGRTTGGELGAIRRLFRRARRRLQRDSDREQLRQ